MKLKTLTAGIVCALAAGSVSAAPTLIDFNDGTAPGFSGSYSLLSSSVPGTATAVNSTPYAAAPEAGGLPSFATYTSTRSITAFTFDWGTPDSYNSLSFGGNGFAVNPIGFSAPITGSGLAAGTYTFRFNASDGVTMVNFGSSRRAFEIDNVLISAVPEPMAWVLMMSGFALVGVTARRRVRRITA